MEDNVGKVKRFVRFDYTEYYPCGGWNDFTGSFDSLEEARNFVQKYPDGRVVRSSKWDLGEIVDLETGEVHELEGG